MNTRPSSSGGPESIREAVRRARRDAVPEFQRLSNHVASLGQANVETITAVARIAVAAKYHYIGEFLVETAIRRGELATFADVFERLAAFGFDPARALVARYRSLAFPLPAVADAIYALIDVADGAANAGRAIDLAFRLGHPHQAAQALEALSTIVRLIPRLLKEVVERFYDHLPRVGVSRVLEWLSRGAAIAASGRREEASAHLQLLTREARSTLDLHFVALSDLRRVLSIYAGSVAGVALEVTELERSPIEFPMAYTDGRTIYLPSRIELFPDRLRNERVFSVIAAQQAAMIQWGAFRFDLGKCSVLDEVRDRYGTLLPNVMDVLRRVYVERAGRIYERGTGEVEAHFTGGARLDLLETYYEDLFFMLPTPFFFREIFVLIETLRVTYLMSLRYPGQREDVRTANGAVWKTRPVIRDPGEDLHEEFLGAVEAMVQYALAGSAKTGAVSRGFAQRLGQLLHEFRAVTRSDADVYTSIETALRVYNRFFDQYPLIAYNADIDPMSLFAYPTKPQFVPESVAHGSPHLLADRPRRERVIEEGRKDRQYVDLASLGDRERNARERKRALMYGALRVYRYPEFDAEREEYRPRFVTLFEGTAGPGDEERVGEVFRNHQAIARKLRRRFLSLRPEEVAYRRKWLDGPEVHIGDAVDYVIDLARGATVDEKIYMQKQVSRRNVAVAVFLDASSSTGTEVAGRAVIDTERDALLLLGSALAALDDRFGLYAYFSMGPKNVFVQAIKDFDEGWTRTTRSRVFGFDPIAGNRDGAAIRHGAYRLSRIDATTRLLLVINDGKPADADYGGRDAADTSAYAIADTKRAVLEARRAGVEPFCITVDTSASSYIRDIYGDFRYRIIREVADLPEALANVYLRLTK